MLIHDDLIKIQDRLKSLEHQNKRAEALTLFDEYIEKFCGIGPYNLEDWPVSWTKTVWDYAASVSHSYSNLFIHKIDNFLHQRPECSEPLEFLKAELIWDRQGMHDFSKKYVENLVQKYPFNIEFKHSYGHILVSNEDDLDMVEKGIDHYLECIRFWKDDHENLLRNVFNFGIRLAKSRYNNGEHDKALDVLDKLLLNKYLVEDSHFNNILIMQKDYIRSSKSLEQRMDGMERKITLDFDERLRNERKKTFELLGLFTAAISFILSTVSLTGVINYEYLIPVLVALGLILVVFVLTISLSLNPEPKLLINFRFYILIIFLIISILLPFIYQNSEYLLTRIMG